MNTLFKIRESFQWLEAIKPLPYPNVIKIVALNAGTTGNNNTYLKEELIRAARTMNGKPIYFGTSHGNNEKKEVGIINWAEFESDRVEAVGTVEPNVYQKIQNGEIPRVSIEANFIYPERIDGIAPKGLEFTGLLLLPQGIAPGDPKTSVAIMERIGEILHIISSKEGMKTPEVIKTLETSETVRPIEGTNASSLDKPSAKIGESGKVQEADYPWDQCISDMQSQGHSADSASRICAAIKNRTVSRTLELGLAKTPEEARKVVAEKVRNDPLFSYLAGKVLELQNGVDKTKTPSTENQESKAIGELRQAIVEIQEKLRSQESEPKPKGKGIVSAPNTREIAGIPIKEVNFDTSEFSDLLRKPMAD